MKDQFLVRKIVFLAVFASACACLQVYNDAFIYWRDALFSEPWRLWTAHWVHVGWMHYLLNMLAFMCLPFIFPRASVWHFAALALLLPPLISVSFYWFMPDVEAYAGLSGVLHGAYAAIAAVHLMYKRERNFAALVLLLILSKLVWENTAGSMGTAQLIGSPVLVEAHLLGVIWGIVLAGGYLAGSYWIEDK